MTQGRRKERDRMTRDVRTGSDVLSYAECRDLLDVDADTGHVIRVNAGPASHPSFFSALPDHAGDCTP
jgi:hypothetical protein